MTKKERNEAIKRAVNIHDLPIWQVADIFGLTEHEVLKILGRA